MILSITTRPTPRYDDPWTEADIDGTPDVTVDPIVWTPIQTFPLDPLDEDPAHPQVRGFTMETVSIDVTNLRIRWHDAVGGEEFTGPIPVAPKYTLASMQDIRMRVGRELTDNETAQIKLLCRLATVTIYSLLPKPSTWLPTGDVLDYLNVVAIEMVARTFANPDDLQSRSESIGNYSYTSRYNRNAPGMALTKVEELALAQVVFGENTASVKVPSQADEYAENIWWPYLLWYGYLPEAEPMAVWK